LDAIVVALADAAHMQVVTTESMSLRAEQEKYRQSLESDPIYQGISEHDIEELLKQQRIAVRKDQRQLKDPWPGFRHDVEAFIHSDEFIVYRRPVRKMSGKLHGKTIYKKGKATRKAYYNDECTQLKINWAPLRGGIVEKGETFRTDIFRKKDKKGTYQFYICPQYKFDAIRGLQAEHVLRKGKPPLPLDESYEFMMSVHKNEYLKLYDKGELKVEGYYRGMNVTNGQLMILGHDNPEATGAKNYGVLLLSHIEKYSVDLNGRLHPVKQPERRVHVAGNRCAKPGKVELKTNAVGVYSRFEEG
jgi:hypothetical protein